MSPAETTSSSPIAWVRAYRFRLLFASFIGLLLVAPFAASHPAMRIVLPVLFVLNLTAVGYGTARGRWHLRALVLTAIGVVGLATFVSDDRLWLARDAVLVVVYVVFFVSLLMHVQRANDVTGEHVFAALTGYLFLIIIFTALYRMVELSFPGSFDGMGDLDADRNAFVYFSLVTQTTLGYGDIQPVSAPARTLAGLHALVGQLYLAVLVARLVAMQLVHREDRA